MSDGEIEAIEAQSERVVDIGDLDSSRNLKFRSMLGLALAPVFRELLPRLRYVELGRRGITPGQYLQDFTIHPARHGFGDRFVGSYRVRLCRSIADDPRGKVERMIIETRAAITGNPALAPSPSLGFEPSLGPPIKAGEARVLHILTRPKNDPGDRMVTEVPDEISFLRLHGFEEPFPTIARLAMLEDDFSEIEGATVETGGFWGTPNSDVFQHVHAREYTMAMENAVTQGLAAAGLPLAGYVPLRARTIFRRPSFVGQDYRLHVGLFRRGADIVALGSFHNGEQGAIVDRDRAAVFLRFDARLS
jgi:hypothetical protein